MSENTAFILKNYFADPRKPGPTVGEFKEFWESLSEEEKQYYRTAELPKG